MQKDGISLSGLRSCFLFEATFGYFKLKKQNEKKIKTKYKNLVLNSLKNFDLIEFV